MIPQAGEEGYGGAARRALTNSWHKICSLSSK
jgi:hypothetical protein